MNQSYVVLDKLVGQTPLEVVECWRATRPELKSVPLAYAGRLDPMAEGKLLILIGEECKKQAEYHNLDKEYVVEVLFGISSDSGDVLGLVSENLQRHIDETKLPAFLHNLVGKVELPYPIFSAKTVQGKPLHTWTMEGRLSEITIPTKISTIYDLELNQIGYLRRDELYKKAIAKIESIAPVVDPRKALGNDFRRPQVRGAWAEIKDYGSKDDRFTIATITCRASSGTYMRTLAEVIAKGLGTTGLALAIKRTKIGRINPAEKNWLQLFN